MARIIIEADDRATSKLKKVREEIQSTDKSIDKLSQNIALEELEKEFNKLGKNTKEAKRLFNDYKRALESGDIAGIERIERQIRGIANETKRADREADKFKSSLMGFAKTVGGLYLVKQAFDGIVNTTKDFIDTSSKWETYENRLSSFISKQSELTNEMQRVKQFAMDNNQAIFGTMDAFIKMKTYGIDPSNEALKTFTNTAIGSGKSLDQFVEAMADAFMGENERLKEFGVKASVVGEQIAYNWTNSSGQAMNIIVDNNSKVIESTLTAIFNEKYIGQMEAFSTSWSGMMQGLSNRWVDLKLQIADEGLFEYFSILANSIMDSLGAAFDYGKGSAAGFVEFIISGVETIIETSAMFVQWGAGIALVFDGIKVAWYGTIYGLGELVSTFVDGAGQAWVWLQNAFGQMANAIGSIWHSILSSMGSALNSFLNSAISAMNALGANISKTNFGKIGEYKSNFKAATYEANKFFNTDWSKNKLTSAVEDFGTQWDKVANDTPNNFAKNLIQKTRDALNSATKQHKSFESERMTAAKKLSDMGAKTGVYAPSKKANKLFSEQASSAKKAFDDQARWNEKFTDDYNQATLSREDYAMQSLNRQRDEYLAHGQDKLKIDEWYNAESAKIHEQYAEKQKSVWGKQSKDMFNQAKSSAGGACKDGNCGGAGKFIDKRTSDKYAKQAGKTFGSSFKDGIVGKKAQKSYESIGSKLGSAFGGAIRGALKDYVNGDGEITLREASRKQFDSKIGGAIYSSLPPQYQFALDLFNAVNTETRNAFQSMETNLDESNTGIADSLSIIADTAHPELELNRKIEQHLSSMNSKFSAIAVAVSTSTGFDYVGNDFDLNTKRSKDIFKDGKLISYEDGGVKGGIGGFISGFMDSLFGTTTKTLEASGIGFGEQTATSFIDGIVDGYQYQDIKIKKSSFFNLSKSTKFKTVKEDMNSQMEQGFADAMRDGYEAIGDAMLALGAKQQNIADVVFEEKKLDFKGKTPEEIQKIITGAMTARLDTLALGMFGDDLKEYKIAGEDYAETVFRVSVQYNEAKYSLDRLGVATVAYTDVANKSAKEFGGEIAKTSLMYKEGMKDVTKVIESSLFGIQLNKEVTEVDKSGLSGIGRYIDTLNASTETVISAYTELHDFQVALVSTSNVFREFNEQMIEGAGSREALLSGQNSLLTDFYSLQEQSAIKTKQMNEELAVMGKSLPATKDEWKKLLEGISDPKLYGRLVSMSADVSDAFKAMEDAAKEATEAMMKQVQAQTDLISAQNKLNDLRIENAKEYDRILKESSKTLRDLARSSQSAKDAIITTGISDNESVDYYINLLNSKEDEFASFFDSNGAVLADKYDDMQRVYGDINSLTSTIAGNLDNYDPERKDPLKENLYSLLSVNQALVNSNAKVMEVRVAGGTLDEIAKELTISEFSTLLGLTQEQKTELAAVTANTTGIFKDATYVEPYPSINVSNMIDNVETGLAKNSTVGSLYKGENIAINNTSFNQGNYIAPETGLMKDRTYKEPYATVGVSNMINDVETGLMKDNTFTPAPTTVSVGNITQAKTDVSGLMKDETFGLVDVSSLMRNSTYKKPYATVGVSNMIPAVETGLMKDNTFEAAPSTVSIGNITQAKTDVSSLAKESTLSTRYAGQAISVNQSNFVAPETGLMKDSSKNKLRITNTTFNQAGYVAPETGLMKDSSKNKLRITNTTFNQAGYVAPETGLMKDSTFDIVDISALAKEATQTAHYGSKVYKQPFASVNVGNITQAKTDVSGLLKDSSKNKLRITNTTFNQAGYVAPETGLMKDSTYKKPYATVGVSNMIPAVETGLMKNSTFTPAPSTVSVGNIASARTNVSSLAKEATLSTRYAGENIAITNEAMSGNIKLSDLFGSTSTGLTGILNLTDEQKQKIASLEAKAAEESSAQTYYKKATTYFDTVLADIARKTEADTRNLSAVSFGATSTLGAQEDVDFQTVLGNAGQVLNASERDALYNELKGFATQADDVAYLKTLIGYDDATGAVANTAKAAQIKAFQPYLPSDATSAYQSIKEKNQNIISNIPTAISQLSDINDNNTDVVPYNDGFKYRAPSGHIFYYDAIRKINPADAAYAGSGYYWLSDTAQNLITKYNLLNSQIYKGFKSGGYTGDGNINEIAGVTHKQEYVVPHKGALVMRENKSEVAELKKQNKLLNEIVMELRQQNSISKRWDRDGVPTIEAEERSVA